MERGLLGHHTAATKERFVIVVDTAVPRLEALTASSGVAEADRWTWLPLTALQARVLGGRQLFRLSGDVARWSRFPCSLCAFASG